MFMQLFYDAWMPYVNRQPSAGDFDWNEFLAISLSHHMEIISKVKRDEERIVEEEMVRNLVIGI